MTADERRTAHLLFAPELASGALSAADLDHPDVARAVRVRRVPPRITRVLQRVAMKRGRLGFEQTVVPRLVAARRALLGAAADGPPRVLLRFDEFPNYAADDLPGRGTEEFRAFHAPLARHGVPYLVAVLPRVPQGWDDPQATAARPWDDDERALLAELREQDGMSFGLHGLDHRTRHRHPRRHSELLGLDRATLEARLDQGQAALAELDLDAQVFVAPFNRFAAGQWPVLAARFPVVTGGPETVLQLGFHPPVQVRGAAVYLPAYWPMYGAAADIADAVEALAEAGAALWAPAVLHLAWEDADGHAGLERLAALLGGGLARPWDELLAAAAASRRTS